MEAVLAVAVHRRFFSFVRARKYARKVRRVWRTSLAREVVKMANSGDRLRTNASLSPHMAPHQHFAATMAEHQRELEAQTDEAIEEGVRVQNEREAKRDRQAEEMVAATREVKAEQERLIKAQQRAARQAEKDNQSARRREWATLAVALLTLGAAIAALFMS